MWLDAIKTALVVAEVKNIQKAAERESLEGNSIRYRIKKLEENLGFQLFIMPRSGRGAKVPVTPTPRGHAFLTLVAPLIEWLAADVSVRE